MSGVLVSDHAVLRYLECGLGVDVEGLRRRLARQVESAPAVYTCEVRVIREGLRFHLRPEPRTGEVLLVTVSSAQREGLCNRARRIRARQKRSGKAG